MIMRVVVKTKFEKRIVGASSYRKKKKKEGDSNRAVYRFVAILNESVQIFEAKNRQRMSIQTKT